jgi:hypothetical protein
MMLSFFLPNSKFYAQLASIEDERDLSEALTTIALYCLVQYMTLFAIVIAYHRRAKISGIRQLAFMLEHQGSYIQNKLVFWVLYNVQASLVHFGTPQLHAEEFLTHDTHMRLLHSQDTTTRSSSSGSVPHQPHDLRASLRPASQLISLTLVEWVQPFLYSE